MNCQYISKLLKTIIDLVLSIVYIINQELVLSNKMRNERVMIIKKVIDGAVYNTETAKMICKQIQNETSHQKGAEVKQLKQLYRTKSGKYFFYIKNEFETYVATNNDDLNPEFELEEVEENKILPVTYDLSVQFASEVLSENPESKKTIETYFPELGEGSMDDNQKIQKKFYISEKANWCLEMLMLETEHTNSSYIEKLIIEEYDKLYGN